MIGVKSAKKGFPHPKFREHQDEVLEKVEEAFETGIETAIIEAPTGIGKSAVNTALARRFPPAFYTTPQRKLVRQIGGDSALKPYVTPLLGRDTYKCGFSGQNCRDCYVRDDEELSCRRIAEKSGECTYWVQKMKAMSSPVALITFANLIIDDSLPPEHAFGSRNLLIVDECHDLEGQAAGMFAGFGVSPYNLPRKVWKKLVKVPKDADFDWLADWLDDVRHRCKLFKGKKAKMDKCDSMIRKIDYMRQELEEKREWVFDVEYITWKGKKIRRPHFKPVEVDLFLQRKVWSKAKKIVLSSATIPFRDNPSRWLKRLGLGERPSRIFKVPISFSVKNRPIRTTFMGGKMTRDKEDRNWKRNVEQVKRIIEYHPNERGVVHTTSYYRAQRLEAELGEEDVYLHQKDGEKGDVIENWKDSGKNILLSPAVVDGVNFKDDLCRFQILFKVPFPSVKDSRVEALLNRGEWSWYWSEAMKDTIQAYGRAVRSKDDFAVFYVVDKSFKDLLGRTKPPSWFKEAINPSPEVLTK